MPLADHPPDIRAELTAIDLVAVVSPPNAEMRTAIAASLRPYYAQAAGSGIVSASEFIDSAAIAVDGEIEANPEFSALVSEDSRMRMRAIIRRDLLAAAEKP